MVKSTYLFLILRMLVVVVKGSVEPAADSCNILICEL